MFRSRNEWFAHELQNHRREWVCQYCQHPAFSDVSAFSGHTKSTHPGVLANSPLEALTLQSEEPVDKIPSTACPLCKDWEADLKRKQANRDLISLASNDGEGMDAYGTPKQFRRHLGRHMEQMALFALPPNDTEVMEDESSDSDEEEVVPRLDESLDLEDVSWNSMYGARLAQMTPQAVKAAEVAEAAKAEATWELEADRVSKLARAQGAEKEESWTGDEDGDSGNSVELASKTSQYHDPVPQHVDTFEEEEMRIKAQQEKHETMNEADPRHHSGEVEEPDIDESPPLTYAEHKIQATAVETAKRLAEKEAAEKAAWEKKIDKKKKEAHAKADENAKREAEEREAAIAEWEKKIGEETKAVGAKAAEHTRIQAEKKAELTAKLKAIEELMRAGGEDYDKAMKELEEARKREEEYQRRLEDDLRKTGMDEREIGVVLKKERAADPDRPTYTRMSRRHLSIETLNRYKIDYEFDTVSTHSLG
jgi:hypothetical protein